MFDTPWLSTPRTSAVTSTSAACLALASVAPSFLKMAVTTLRRSPGRMRTASPSLTRKISSIVTPLWSLRTWSKTRPLALRGPQDEFGLRAGVWSLHFGDGGAYCLAIRGNFCDREADRVDAAHVD